MWTGSRGADGVGAGQGVQVRVGTGWVATPAGRKGKERPAGRAERTEPSPGHATVRNKEAVSRQAGGARRGQQPGTGRGVAPGRCSPGGAGPSAVTHSHNALALDPVP